MQAITRAGARDVIRHQLGKITSKEQFDLYGLGTGAVGDPSSQFPNPSNALINEQLDLAVGFVNQKCEIGHVQDVNVSVPLTTANGPQFIDLKMIFDAIDGLSLGEINIVKRAYWDNGFSTYRLYGKLREEIDRDSASYGYEELYGFNSWLSIPGSAREWQSMVPGNPQWYWIEGYGLYLLPGSNMPATLHLVVGTGILHFVNDLDTIGQLPTDHHKTIWDTATAFVAGTAQSDAEMSAAEIKFTQKAMMGIHDIIEWKRSVNQPVQATIAVRTGRSALHELRGRRNMLTRRGGW